MTEPTKPPGSGRAALVGLLLILAVWAIVYLPGLKTLPLCDPEESRCAVTVANMLSTGDSLVPQLGGRPYLEKPPLFFWLAAAGTRLTGELELGGRLVSALAALGMALAAGVLGRRMFSSLAGVIAALAVLVCVEVFALGRWYRMEMLFTFLMVMAVACFWLGRSRRAGGRTARLGFFLFLALATLTKGPLGVLLPLLVIVAYLLVSGQWRRLVELLYLPGLALLALLAAPWFVYMTLKFPGDFVQEFFVGSHLDRAMQGFEGNIMPPGFYLLVLAVGLLPWTLLLPAMIRRSFPWARLVECSPQLVLRTFSVRPAVLMLWLWAVTVVLFFELSRTKFLHYILSAFVPLSILAGEYLAALIAQGESSAKDRLFRSSQWAALLGGIVLAAGFPIAELRLTGTDTWALVMVPAALASSLIILYSIRKARPKVFVAGVVVGMVFLSLYVSLHAMPRIYSRLSLKQEGLAARERLRSNEEVYVVGGKRWSLIVYAGRPDAVRLSMQQAEDFLHHLDRPVALLMEETDELPQLTKTSALVRFSEPVWLSRQVVLLRVRPLPATATATAPER